MEKVIILVTFLYLASSAGYLLYLFLQKNMLYRISGYILLIAFLTHTAEIGYDYVLAGHIPVRNLHETLSVIAWVVAGLYMLFQYKFRLKALGAFTVPLSGFIMAVCALMPQASVEIQNNFRSAWVIFHILAIFSGEAALAMACGIGIMYLVQEKAIKTKKRSFFYKRLPSLDLLDSAGYTCVVVGFTLITIGLATGFIYAKMIWGKFLSWDPKEVWSAITWLLYAVLIHERMVFGWRGRKAAIMAIIGFCAVVFTFLGVNFFLKGHHEIFTR